MRYGAAFVFVLAATVAFVAACGVTTHIEVAHRAINYIPSSHYGDLIRANQDAYQAGNPFPDAFYACSTYHGIADDTHAGAFMKFALQWVRENRPKPWTWQTEKLVVFLLGVASHQIADSLWHGHLCGVELGFLESMGLVNFDDYTERAHVVGDYGGDVVANYDLDLKYVNIVKWYVPVVELELILNAFYQSHLSPAKPVPSTLEMIKCTTIMFAARLGELAAVSKAYVSYMSKSPFLVDMYNNYFLGGVDDMALWTARYFNDTIQLLEQGQEGCDFYSNPQCTSCGTSPLPFYGGIDCGTKVPPIAQGVAHVSAATAALHGPTNTVARARLPQALRLSNHSHLPPLDEDKVKVERVDGGLYISQTAPQSDRVRASAAGASLLAAPLAALSQLLPSKSDAVLISASTEYGTFSESMATGDFNGDSYPDLVLGQPLFGDSTAPHSGRVSIVFGGPNKPADRIIEQSADVVLDGIDRFGRFGTSVAVVDLNRDGLDDLAVSAPTADLEHMQYSGKVYVFYGSAHGLQKTPSVVITGVSVHKTLGYKMAGGDLDGDNHADLVLASPFDGPNESAAARQRGTVQVFLSGGSLASCFASALCNTDSSKADWASMGEVSGAWYGMHVSVAPAATTGRAPLLLVGAPYHNSVGKVYGWSFANAGQPSLQFSVSASGSSGHNLFAKVGMSVAVGRPHGPGTAPVLAVGAPGTYVGGVVAKVYHTTWNHSGAVYLFDLAGLTPDVDVSSAHDFIHGDRHGSRFGVRMAFADFNGDHNDDLVITVPHRNLDPTGVFASDLDSMALVFHGGSSFVSGDVSQKACGFLSVATPCPLDAASIVLHDPTHGINEFGLSLQPLDFNRDGKVDLAIGAPGGSQSSRRGGQAVLFFSK